MLTRKGGGESRCKHFGGPSTVLRCVGFAYASYGGFRMTGAYFRLENSQTTMTSSSTPKNSECVAVLTNRIAARSAKPPKSSARIATAASLAVVAGFNA